MDHHGSSDDDGIAVTSFKKKEVTAQPISDEVPSYSEVVLGNGANHVIDMKLDNTPTTPPTSPYANMSKEDVLRFSNTPFWKTARLIALVSFWLLWLAFLATVIALTITTPRCGLAPIKQWYEKSVFYDVYVRSFYDSDNNGVGDIKGIEEKLPLLKEMGVGVVVLSSILKSRDLNSGSASEYNGKFDYGYEVIDYKAVDSSLGTIEDLKSLIDVTHHLDMKIVMDFVPNHSGIDHPWFEAFKAANDYKANWNNYLSANQIPNNWANYYDQGLVTWTPTRTTASKLYYHQFLRTQPELNLRSNHIRKELEKSMVFWLDLGLDGFRIVNSDLLIEDADLKDNPVDKFTQSRYQNDSIDLIARWNTLMENYHEDTRVLITDGDSKQPDFTDRYYKERCGMGSHVPMNFDLMTVTAQNKKPESVVKSLKNFITKIPHGSIALWTTGNKDESRLESRAGVNMTRPLTLMKMTLPGSALLYYGEEIEMVDDVEKANLVKDVLVDIGATENLSLSRYGYRQPMYWSNATNAGFSLSTHPWLSINPGVDIIEGNFEYQRSDENSVWKLLSDLSELRNKHTSLQHGDTHFGYYDHNLVTYLREYQGDDRLLVVVNIGDTESQEADVTKDYSYPIEHKATILITTHPSMGPYHEGDEVKLKQVEELPTGYGFVAKWKYVRSL